MYTCDVEIDLSTPSISRYEVKGAQMAFYLEVNDMVMKASHCEHVRGYSLKGRVELLTCGVAYLGAIPVLF
jgi:hypothetical protein